MQDSCIAASEKLNLLPRSKLGNSIEATDRLRQAVAQRVRNIQGNAHLAADERSSQLQTMAHFAIVEWGGLGSNRQETLHAYVERFVPVGLQLDEIDSYQSLMQQVPSKRGQLFDAKGISSWSKWLNFIWSDWALIYDARIAFALNAIHYMASLNAPVLHVPDGRNSLLRMLDSESIAALHMLYRKGIQQPQQTSELTGWVRKQALVAQNDIYPYYLEIMLSTHDLLWETDTPLVHTEMLLFMLSVQDIASAFMQRLGRQLQHTCAASQTQLPTGHLGHSVFA